MKDSRTPEIPSNLKSALIGFGSVARYAHLPWHLNNPSVEISAVVEPTPRGRALARDLLPDVPVFPSLAALFDAQSVTFVDITAQPSAHRELVLEAVARGAHVICEKPFVTDWKALQEIDATRRDCGPIIAACHNWYFAPAISRGLELVNRGAIGKPQEVAFVAHRPRPAEGAAHWRPTWRQSVSEGGGIIGDLGYHGFYLMCGLFRRAPFFVQVRSVECPKDNLGAEMAASLELDFGDGRRASLALSWLSDVRSTTLKVKGSHGCLMVSGSGLRLTGAVGVPLEEDFDELTADSWHATWTAATLDQFLVAIGRGDRDTCWREITWSVAVLDAAYASIKAGGAVTNLRVPASGIGTTMPDAEH